MSDPPDKARLDRARQLQDAVAHILLHNWDPIGVADTPQAQDEYDGYVWQVCALLIRREPRHKLVDYLWWAETEHMALRGSRPRTEHIVDLLLQIPNAIDGDLPATHN